MNEVWENEMYKHKAKANISSSVLSSRTTCTMSITLLLKLFTPRVSYRDIYF